MNFRTEKKPLIEAALIASMACVFVIISLYIPLLTILFFLLPVPFIVLSVRHPIKYAILSLVVVCFFTGLLLEVIYTVFILIVFGPIAIIMGYLMRKKRREFEVILAGTMASAVSIFLAMQIISMLSGINLIEQMGALFRESIYNQMKMMPQINVTEVRMNEAITYFISIFPALIVVQSMIGAVINYYLSVAILKRSSFYKDKTPSFSSFKLPNNIIVGFLLLVVLAFLTRFIEGIYYENLIQNITTIFMFLLFLQGISVIVFFMEKIKINKFIKILLIIFIVLMGTLITFVALAGFIDAVFNIRKLNRSQ